MTKKQRRWKRQISGCPLCSEEFKLRPGSRVPRHNVVRGITVENDWCKGEGKKTTQ